MLQFGFYDSKIVGDSYQNADINDQGIKWFETTSGSRWKTKLNYVKVGNSSVRASGYDQDALLDTGSSFMYMPKQEFAAFYKSI